MERREGHLFEENRGEGMRTNEATAFENEFFYRKRGTVSILMVRKVKKGTSMAIQSMDAIRLE